VRDAHGRDTPGQLRPAIQRRVTAFGRKRSGQGASRERASRPPPHGLSIEPELLTETAIAEQLRALTADERQTHDRESAATLAIHGATLAINGDKRSHRKRPQAFDFHGDRRETPTLERNRGKASHVLDNGDFASEQN
jgi:hypothetical protein